MCPPRRLLQAVYVRCLGLVGEAPLPTLDRPGAAVAAFWCGDEWFDSTDAGGVIRTYGAVASSTIVSRALPSWNRSILAEICLCHACSCHEIEDGNGPVWLRFAYATPVLAKQLRMETHRQARRCAVPAPPYPRRSALAGPAPPPPQPPRRRVTFAPGSSSDHRLSAGGSAPEPYEYINEFMSMAD
eukprot:COSAG01_NODE_2061_length_8482_cov_6.301925_7_plen_186_part_00